MRFLYSYIYNLICHQKKAVILAIKWSSTVESTVE